MSCFMWLQGWQLHLQHVSRPFLRDAGGSGEAARSRMLHAMSIAASVLLHDSCVQRAKQCTMAAVDKRS
jgi:hypothetical protein